MHALGFSTQMQNLQGCVFLKNAHWIHISYTGDYEAPTKVESVFLNQGDEMPAPLDETERSLCKQICKCLQALNH